MRRASMEAGEVRRRCLRCATQREGRGEKKSDRERERERESSKESERESSKERESSREREGEERVRKEQYSQREGKSGKNEMRTARARLHT